MPALAIVAALTLAQPWNPDDKEGRFARFTSRTDQGRSDRGFDANSLAFFEFAPASGAGMGTACACAAVTGSKGEALTFTRASAAWCTKSDYSLVSCGNNLPRVMSGTGGTSPLGLFVEDTATNNLLQNRDWSQAVWTKTTMTCALTSTGVDGAANSASTCTASAGNGTALQTVTIAAATRNTSGYIRRRTGSGTIEVTRDNGTTWTAITASVTGTYKRVVSTEAVGCAYGNCIIVPAMTSGGANPVIGIRLGTSGDAVDLDLWQDEANAFPSSPITTTAAATTRAAESATAPAANTFLSLAYSVVMTGWPSGGTFANGIDVRTDGTHFFSAYSNANTADLGAAPFCYAFSGVGTQGSGSIFIPPLGPTPVRCALTSGASVDTSVAGYAFTTATAATSVPVTTASLGGGILPLGGILTDVCMDSSVNACKARRTHPTAIAWVGDSITRGDAAAPSRPPAVLRGLLPGRTILNMGVNGQTADLCALAAQGAIAARAKTLVLLCGVNSLGGGATWATIQPALDAAKAAGMTVVPVKLTPWASAGTWSAPKQTEQDAFNVSMQAWCTANGATCVDTSSLGTGSPASLQAGYNSGDGLHLNAAGGAALAALVQAANP